MQKLEERGKGNYEYTVVLNANHAFFSALGVT